MTRRHPFGTLWNEINLAQDEFAKWVGRASTVQAIPGPQLSVWEDENTVFAEADLPGIDLANLEISVTEGTQLTITGERKPPEVDPKAWVRQERPFGKFTRAVELPALVDAEKVEAKYVDGVLKLTLPKHEAVRPRKIVVKNS